MEKIGPGMYVDRERKNLHIYAEEMCEAFGVPITEENLQRAERAAVKMAEDSIGRSIPVCRMVGSAPPEDPN